MAQLVKEHRNAGDTDFLFDNTLSLKAKGVMCCLLNLVNGQDVSAEYLADTSADGITAVSGAIRELADHDYLERVRERDSAGRVSGSFWII